MLAKPKLFLDMDNVLVDTLSVLNTLDMAQFQVDKPDQIPGIFRHLPPMSGAVEGINVLAADFELYILSTAPWRNPSAWQDKLLWLTDHFGNDNNSPFYKRVILTHDKGIVHKTGGILLDDRPYHGASQWQDNTVDSLWLQYGYNTNLVWSKDLVAYLQAVAKSYQLSGKLRMSAENIAKDKHYQLFGHTETFEKAPWE